jgi:hypothetical protein
MNKTKDRKKRKGKKFVLLVIKLGRTLPPLCTKTRTKRTLSTQVAAMVYVIREDGWVKFSRM